MFWVILKLIAFIAYQEQNIYHILWIFCCSVFFWRVKKRKKKQFKTFHYVVEKFILVCTFRYFYIFHINFFFLEINERFYTYIAFDYECHRFCLCMSVPHWKTKHFFFHSTWSAFIIIMRLLTITIENKVVTNSLAFITYEKPYIQRERSIEIEREK